MANKRIFYAVHQALIAPTGGTFASGSVVHGLQSIGVNTQFNLEQVFEIGQLEIYQNIENIPDIECTLEKVLDGYPLVYHLATPNAVSPTLVGRSNDKCQLALSIYPDTQDSASGTPTAEIFVSGLFVSSLSYTFPVDGNFTESVTLVGNNKVYRTSSFAAGDQGYFPTNNDSPIGASGVLRRQHMIFGTGAGVTRLPASVRGINSSGWNTLDANGDYNAHVQNVTCSVSLGRENLNELGRKGPYHRFASFPAQTTCSVEIIAVDGDGVTALESQDNVVDETIFIATRNTFTLDMGSRNKLESVSYGGGDAGTGGGNVNITYSYTGFNNFTVKQSGDPAGFYP